jgi:hypothetical protein
MTNLIVPNGTSMKIMASIEKPRAARENQVPFEAILMSRFVVWLFDNLPYSNNPWRMPESQFIPPVATIER